MSYRLTVTYTTDRFGVTYTVPTTNWTYLTDEGLIAIPLSNGKLVLVADSVRSLEWLEVVRDDAFVSEIQNA